MTTNEELMERLQTHGRFSDEEMELFKYAVVASDYISRFKPDGVLAMPGMKYYRPDGSEYTFQDVPFKKFKESVVSHIKNNVPHDRRIEVFEKVMAGVPGRMKIPQWAKGAVNPHEKPETPFSVSRASPDSVKTSAELIDSLASAADLDSKSVAMIRANITWWDAMGDDEQPPMLRAGAWTVSGGRLGRDHTLEDVPNHYVRDRLMDYIDTQLEEDKRDNARAAVFPDLSPDERSQYSAHIAKQRQDDEAQEERDMRGETVRDILGGKRVKNYSELENVWRQADVIDAIDEKIDLTPDLGRGLGGGSRRDYERYSPISCSVVEPGKKEQLLRERSVEAGDSIDRNCDQIRAMIKLFTRGGEWTVDQFRLALGGVSRVQLTDFLDKRGPTEGMNTAVFQLGWEFFKKRELLGLPLTKQVNDDALKERDPNRGQKKRASAGSQHDSTDAKRTRTSARLKAKTAKA
ncbi:hypothetical protein F4779DRAFT_575966 [Xylariaceae sp. FL0662B]|nr:hypothetical protein F4779DRAFT_575966 [Xylariaceae sp. FL0662B]